MLSYRLGWQLCYFTGLVSIIVGAILAFAWMSPVPSHISLSDLPGEGLSFLASHGFVPVAFADGDSGDGSSDGGGCCGDGGGVDAGGSDSGCCTAGDSESGSSETPPDVPCCAPPPPKGCIEVHKIALDSYGNPIAPVPQFTFKLDGGVRIAVNDGNGVAIFDNVSVGNHSVSEIVPDGWELVSVDPASGIVSVVAKSPTVFNLVYDFAGNLQKDYSITSPSPQCVKITFKDKQKPPPKGCVAVLKETFNAAGQPISPVAQFTFHLDDGQTAYNNSNGVAQFNNVSPGWHTVTEDVPDGWELFLVTPANGTVYVSPGSDCAGVTFKNKQKTIVTPPPSCTINAVPDHIVIEEDPLLTWTSQNATSASLNNGIGSVSTNGELHVFPTQTTTYILTVQGPGGTAQCQKTVTVTTVVVQPATCHISSNPQSIQLGQSSTLTWDSTDSTLQWISGIGDVTQQGSMSVSPQVTTTYVFHVSGLGGNGECQTTVTVTDEPPPPETHHPTCTLTGVPPHTTAGAPVTLSWTSTNATSVTFSGAQGGSVGLSGSFTVFPLVTTTYEIVASDGTESATCTATVTVDEETQKVIKCILPADMMPSEQNKGTLVSMLTSAFQSFSTFLEGVGISNWFGNATVEVSSQ